MIQRQLKLKLTKRQERQLESWLPTLAAIWNWAVRKIELDGRDALYHTSKGFQNLLANHGPKVGIPSHTIQGMLLQAHDSWQRCFKKQAKKPRLKGRRNKLNSIPFPDPFQAPHNNRVKVPRIGRVRFYKQKLPVGKIKCGRIVKRASGWHLCLFIDAEPNAVPAVGRGCAGIDPGFNSLLALSTGEKVEHPRELRLSALRLAQAQRGGNKKLAARISEHVASQRKGP